MATVTGDVHSGVDVERTLAGQLSAHSDLGGAPLARDRCGPVRARPGFDSRKGMRRLRHSRVFRPRFPENRNVRIGVLPERQEIAVGTLRLHRVARKRERSRQLQARHRVHGIDEDDASVIENPLELGGGFGGLTCCDVRQSANIDGIHAAETCDEASRRPGARS